MSIESIVLVHKFDFSNHDFCWLVDKCVFVLWWDFLSQGYRSWPTNDVISHRDYIKLYKKCINSTQVNPEDSSVWFRICCAITILCGFGFSCVHQLIHYHIFSNLMIKYEMLLEKNNLMYIIKIGSKCLFNIWLSWFHTPINMKDNYFKKYQEQDNTCISKLLLTIVVAYQTGKDEVSKAKTTIGPKKHKAE